MHTQNRLLGVRLLKCEPTLATESCCTKGPPCPYKLLTLLPMKVLRTPAIPSTQSAGKVYNQNSRHLESGFLPGFCWLLDQSLLLHIALLPFNLFNMAFQMTSARSCPFPPQNLPTPSHLNQIGDGIHVCACVYKCVCPCEHVWRPKASVKCLPPYFLRCNLSLARAHG